MIFIIKQVDITSAQRASIKVLAEQNQHPQIKEGQKYN